MSCKSILIEFIKKHWVRYLAGVLVMLATTLLNTYIPRLTGIIINLFGVSGGAAADVMPYVGQLAGIAMFAFALRFCSRYLIMGLSRNLELRLREAIFTKFQSLSADFYVTHNTGDMITRSIIDVTQIRMVFSFGITGMFDIIVITTVSVIYMVATTNPILTAIAVVPIPFIVLALSGIRKIVRKRFLHLQQTISKISSKVQENITGIRVVKAFVQEESESSIFTEHSYKKWDAEMSAARVSSTMNPMIAVAFGIIFTVFLIFGAQMIQNGSITIGDYVAFNSYILLLMDPVARASRIIMVWQRAGVSMERVDNILKPVPSVRDDRSDAAITDISPCDVRFDKLTYSYPSSQKPVLSDISLTLREGGVLAVMGPTGSGKSTIANLLIRLWDIETGMISIGGNDIGKIPLEVLRSRVAYVPQDTFLFSDTVENNIIFHDDRFTLDDAEAAARATVVHENIMDFELGYQTVVGERGMTLSGGQKQRIAIARALIRKPKLLLLDDCLSAVDSETEHAILTNLKEYVKNCTTVLVTHRISAAMLADNILLLNADGSVNGIGTHDELFSSNETYRMLVETTHAEESLIKDGDGI